ncbi:ThiF family adenylyltransferase [Xenorhabdus bovienii]|uniref:ThiF family adenylyltransferase n=1 Tax=Xenorhabdus bovienii TaxID=40576 RepID=UPI0023B22E08|nr:ThiF family adenylyltransferase [Xenorhabdus bovienii]
MAAMRPSLNYDCQQQLKVWIDYLFYLMSGFRMSNFISGIQSIETISIDELKELNSFLLVDVRESHEFANGTIPEALTLGRGFLEIELKKRQIEPNHPIVLFCSSGLRSKYAALGLIALDFVNIYSLDGGFEAWKAQGNPVEQPTILREAEKNRYARPISLKEVGTHGQLKIMKSKVLVIGVGGLGSSCLLYLAAAGVGEIAIVDHDIVDLGNLQRQVTGGDSGPFSEPHNGYCDCVIWSLLCSFDLYRRWYRTNAIYFARNSCYCIDGGDFSVLPKNCPTNRY